MEIDHQQILTKIYKYCAYQDRCTSEVSQKLLDLGLPHNELEDFLIHLENEKFLNDERFTISFVRGKFNYRRWGRIKIRHGLRAKSIPEHLIEQALQSEISDEDYRNVIAKLVEKKSVQLGDLDDFTKKDKIARYLLQKGFEWGEFGDFLRG